jgi:mannose-6-phosphate isomerase-like protein (cupin superfamily)
MEHRSHDTAGSFRFGNLTIRDVTPGVLPELSLIEVDVPIGADNPPFAAADKKKVYVGVSGEIEFDVGDERVRVRSGDVLLVEPGEAYSYHNGGYEPGRLLLLQMPGTTGS